MYAEILEIENLLQLGYDPDWAQLQRDLEGNAWPSALNDGERHILEGIVKTKSAFHMGAFVRRSRSYYRDLWMDLGTPLTHDEWVEAFQAKGETA